MVEHVDVVIVGAGIAGIDAAYHLQTKCPQKTYAILEARERLGGTWDLFRYPGIRSDSDMYTLGFPFRPWPGDHAIADGASILTYVRETAELYGIDRKIRYQHRVKHARWSSATSRWTLELAVGDEVRELTCSFLHLCVGYYNYEHGYTPQLAGRERFAGRIVHPQQWTDDIDYTGKRVIVIGSGATAVTLVPALAERAAHVTMLQRSPTYIMSRPARDPIATRAHRRLPAAHAFRVTRWKSLLLGSAFYAFCRRYPDRAKRLLVDLVAKHVGAEAAAAHFTPSYNPWDQRLCLVPDADLFAAINEGRASVVTDHIDTFTETGIRLRSGTELEADLIVTATGIEMMCFGAIELEVDGKRVDPPSTLVYRGMMCSDVPNFAFSTGYTNASWTLRCDLTSRYLCRLLNYMDKHGIVRCCPRRDGTVKEAPWIGFTSGYILRGVPKFPRQGTEAPWRLRQFYPLDVMSFYRRPIDDGVMELQRNAASTSS